jgi:hypothetical protein
MDFNVKLVNRRGWWLLLGIIGIVLLAGWLIPLLSTYNAFLTAGAGVVILFGGGWLLWRIEIAIQQPIRISVLVNELVMVNQQTNISRSLRFDDIAAYRFFPDVRGVSTLRFTLQNGGKVKLVARDAGLSRTSTGQFKTMASAFEAAWYLYKAE